MKLWKLKTREKDDEPWNSCQAFVVRARSEEAARGIAFQHSNAACDPDRPSDPINGGLVSPDTIREARWLDPHQTTCKEVTRDGKAGLIVRDYYEA